MLLRATRLRVFAVIVATGAQTVEQNFRLRRLLE